MPTMEMHRLAKLLELCRVSLVCIDDPHVSRSALWLTRLGIAAAAFCCTATAVASSPSLFEQLLAADTALIRDDRSDVAEAAFDNLAAAAFPCESLKGRRAARCVVDVLFAAGEPLSVVESGDPASSTITSALTSHSGNCAALAALALAVADRVGVPMEAVVFRQHVVVRARGDDADVFELLEHGAALHFAQLQRRLGVDGTHYTVVGPRGFLPYYLDNFGVRLAEAGDDDRAVAAFEQAIKAGPRVARVRFNYGTYLLGKGRIGPAEDQLRRAVWLEPKDAAAWANLGVAIAKRGDTAEARRCFERSLHHDPGNAIAAENLKALNSGGSSPRP